MTVLDRHVLREWLKVLGLVLGATLGLFVLQDLTKNLGDFLDYGAAVHDILYFELVSLPAAVPIVLPVAVLVSLLYSFGTLHRNNELTAMRAAGLGIFRIVRPVWVFGLFLTAGLWYLNSTLIPWSVEEASSVQERIKHEARARKSGAETAAVVHAIGFDNARAGRMWFLNRFDVYSQRAHGVTVSVLDAQRREVRRIVAAEAHYDRQRKGWVFLAGREYQLDPATGEFVTWNLGDFASKFEPTFNEDTSLMLLLRKDHDDLSMDELRRVLDYLVAEKNPRAVSYAVDYARKQANPFGVLVVMALGIPFAVTGVRVNPAVGVSKSLGFFVAYYLLNSLGTMLGNRGSVDPDVAAWLPHGVALLVAVWAFRRVE